ncbi:hypothetical protein F2P81_019968 [Scophthalmus maximus]|uniref:Uncharacterized protein n=1 Tax=Scophthalmus maximus TaxID=52904 RepID=A0A6A4S2J9_SCOMX|nr:hypothetical protein F2P81_019968 [Scophthalmus maximus]
MCQMLFNELVESPILMCSPVLIGRAHYPACASIPLPSVVLSEQVACVQASSSSSSSSSGGDQSPCHYSLQRKLFMGLQR